MQITVPPIFITEMTEVRQASRVDLGVVFAQQVNHGVAPDLLDLFLFKEQLPPGAVFDVEATAGDGDVDMRVLIELPAVGMERTEDTDFDPLLARPAEHGAGGQRNRSLSRSQLLLKNGHSRCDMVKVMCCQSQSGRMCCCSAIHSSVALRPQLLQALDLQLWQKKRAWVQSGEAQQ